jgi:hypothetical protein
MVTHFIAGVHFERIPGHRPEVLSYQPSKQSTEFKIISDTTKVYNPKPALASPNADQFLLTSGKIC